MKKFLKALLVSLMVISTSACSPSSNEVIFKAGTYSASEKGFGGEISVEVTLSNEGIDSVNADCSAETDGIGKVACELLSTTMVEKQFVSVDTISGATITSEALIKAVSAALKTADIDATKLVAKENEGSKEETLEFDVAIIGAGGAGMIAAMEASDAGKKVVVIEKTSMSGGNTSRSTGGMNAAFTPEQKAAGIEDSIELFIKDTMVGGKDLNNPELVKALAENSADGIVWLRANGADLSSVGLFGGASVKRIHRPVNAEGKTIAVGSYLVPILTKNLTDRGINVLYDTTATEILATDGTVTGVKAHSNEKSYTINAKAVVICSGGFGANSEMVESYQPSLKGFMTTNAASITGDGIKMGVAIGADTVDMDQIQIHPTVEANTSALITEGLRGDGAILVNQEGKRFTNELLTRDVVSAAEIAQTGSYAYLVIDQAMVDASAVIQGYVKNGYTISGTTYEELATNLKIDAATFAATMNGWNAIVKAKADPDFSREGMENDLSTAPYYAIKVSPGVHHTMGGLKINANTQVLDTKGNVINGLFAAGEVSGGVHGANRLGGNAVSDIVVFGRIAGQNAAAYNK